MPVSDIVATSQNNPPYFIPPSSPAQSTRTWATLAAEAEFRADRLAMLCGVSLRTLQRHFRNQYGLTVKEWIRTVRLEQARTRLMLGEGVKQVAFDLNYKQLSHFSRAFKDRFGVPPRFLSAANPVNAQPLDRIP